MPEINTNVKQKDPYSGEFFAPKRPNQRFICKENQIKYNNLKARKIRAKTAYINKPLQRNFKILEELVLNRTERTVHKQFMLGMGYSFEVYTSLEKHENKDSFALYNYIIIPVENNQIKIVKQ